jgi:Protein of unknown function (DUF3311)
MAKPQVSRTHAPRIALLVTAAVLLAASLVAVLWVPFYDKTTPAVGGFPFFYWYQLLWVPIVAILGALAYAVTRAAWPGSGSAAAPPGSQAAAPPDRDRAGEGS